MGKNSNLWVKGMTLFLDWKSKVRVVSVNTGGVILSSSSLCSIRVVALRGFCNKGLLQQVVVAIRGCCNKGFIQ